MSPSRFPFFPFVCFWLATFLLSATAFAEVRSWTSQDGRSLKADLVTYDAAGGKVTLKLASGAAAVVAVETLSAEDQTFLTDWQRQIDEKAAAAKANAGKTIDYQSDGPGAVAYHVYFPTNYNALTPPPMLILFSGSGKGASILGSVKEACESLGWIGVGCDGFKNHSDESILDKQWQEVLPHIEKTVAHDPGLLYLGGMSGGALRAYDYSESTVRPWKGVLAFGGWLGGKATLHCAPKMAVAIVNGDNDKAANANAIGDEKVLRSARCRVKQFSFPGGHQVAPAPVVLEALQWIQENTVPGDRESAGKRSPTPNDPDFSKVK